MKLQVKIIMDVDNRYHPLELKTLCSEFEDKCHELFSSKYFSNKFAVTVELVDEVKPQPKG